MVHGKNAAIFVDKYNVSPFLQGFSFDRSIEPAETTCFGATGGAKTYIAGLQDGTISMEGFFDGAASAIDEVLNGIALSNVAATLLPQGSGVLGNRAWIASAGETSYGVSTPVGGIVSVNADMQATAGIYGGHLLHIPALVAASSNDASLDNAASSANGGVATLHCTATSTPTSLVVKVQHSVDDAVWVDLVTFATLATTGSEVKTVTGTINRYVRVLWTLTGSFNFVVGFARL